MKTHRFRISFLFLFVLLFSLVLCFSVSAEEDEGKAFNITLTEPNSATVSVKVDGETQSGSALHVAPGSAVSVSITPNSGYTFEKWTSAPSLAEISDPAMTDISFTMPDEDVSLSAVLKKAEAKEYTLSITINDTSYGAADVNDSFWGATIREKKFKEGTTITLKANVNAGYRFVKWTDLNTSLVGVDLSGREVTFAMPDRDVSLHLDFEAIVYYFNVVVQGEGEVEVEGKEKNSSGKYECTVGEEIPVLATPGEEYEFLNWYGNNYSEFENFDEPSTTLICPASDFTVTANFASSVKELTLTSTVGGSARLGVNASEGTSALPSGEPIRCGVDQIYRLEAIADTGYVFSHWECTTTLGKFSDDKAANAEFTMPNDDCTVTAVFIKGTYRVILEKPTGGTATVTEGAFEMGTTVNLAATALPGYVFSYWDCAMEDVVADPTAAETTAVIPGSDVKIKAVFVLKANVDPNVSTPQDSDDGSGFPWGAIVVVFLLSAAAIALIIVREKYNLSYRYLVKKLWKQIKKK